MIAKENFQEYCISQIESWFESLKKRDYISCNSISNKHIATCIEILKNNLWQNSEIENNLAFISGVLFKGLIEYVQLAELTGDENWPNDHKNTETIWSLMWNCIARFEFCSDYFKAVEFDDIMKRLVALKENFKANFGSGLYFSSEIFISREICSICQQDTRACMHIPGRLYGGIKCYSVAEDIKIHSVSIVTNPKDPRCRLWPWNMNEDKTMTFNGVMMTFFRIDDWLNDENEISQTILKP